MDIDRNTIGNMKKLIPPDTLKRIIKAVDWIVDAKKRGKKVVAVVGSGPNIHEGVTTLIAELIHKEIIDGVTTSSAVINHEMGGTLEKVKRIRGAELGYKEDELPADGYIEAGIIHEDLFEKYSAFREIDMKLYKKMLDLDGDIITKVAGNIAYPTGLYTELVSPHILEMAQKKKMPFELIAGKGADPMTMIGAGALNGIPILVSVPQLVGGGAVGLSVGDSIPVSERSLQVAKLLDSADVIIESAIALTQEIHDGPFETFTGHGIWQRWNKKWGFSLREKKVIRIDMDSNLENVWSRERKSKSISNAVNKGLPKTKSLKVPFRMEMSGFARIPGSLPIIIDIGVCWPVMATMVADSLGISLDFMCYKQSLSEGKKIREWIVNNVKPIDMEMIKKNENVNY